jgi:hypothetical protein
MIFSADDSNIEETEIIVLSSLSFSYLLVELTEKGDRMVIWKVCLETKCVSFPHLLIVESDKLVILNYLRYSVQKAPV